MGVANGAADLALERRLQTLIERECGAYHRVQSLAVLEDGHAGLTFSFDVVDDQDRPQGAYVLKLAPSGVTRRGNTDVYRQAPLLRALHRAGVLVPDVPWASPDEIDLGTPFIIMERLAGRTFVVWEPHPSFPTDDHFRRDVWLKAARLLASLHRVDWRGVLPDWEAPRALQEEFERWPHVLRHAQQPDWLDAGTRLGAKLAANLPADISVGIVHGDFQPGNILFDGDRATGVIDWELASIGSQALDVGWMLMMSDPRAWHPDWSPIAPVLAEDLIGAYRDAGGLAAHHLEWHQALAHYRLGAIACLNVKLHRTAKRIDPLWERFAPSISHLFARGDALVDKALKRK